jgi:DNA mismatch repair protein MutS
MFFTTDKQTLEDLNIFGRQGSDSIYSIFNRCATRGGAAVLEEMFRYPLRDATALNRRSGIIQYFSIEGTAFPFSSTDFDGIEAYLSNTDERSKVSGQDQSLKSKLSNLIVANTETHLIHKAITALAELLKDLQHVIRSLNLGTNDSYYDDSIATLALMAEMSRPALLDQQSAKLSHDQLAEYDLMFRFRNRDAMIKLLRQVYHLDVYTAVATAARERNFVFPIALPGTHELIIEGLYHPQVKNAVANAVRLGSDKNMIFLTGANMAGKSTFMKSVSVAIYLAHMGFPVAARKMEFSVMDGIYTNINLPDSIGMGASHFYAEVLRVKKVAKELSEGKNLFIVFDELFRGTNVKDAYEATIAVVGAFAAKRHSIFVISTHIIEAGEILRMRHENLRFLYLPTRMEGSKPVYTYTLKEGITDDRHGMVIINNERILEILEAGMNQID